MTKKTGWQRLLEFWMTPKQWMLVERDNARPAKNFHIRPITILMVPALSLVLGVLFSYSHIPPQKNNDMEIMLHTLKQQFSNIRAQLVTAQAENELKQAQVNSLKKMLAQQQDEISDLQQRIHVFNSILQARKGHHVQIVQNSLQTTSPQRLLFHVTLVKGGSYPRHIRGYLQFTYHDAAGNEHHLRFNNEKERLPYEMETHTFVQGEIHVAEPIHLPQHPRIELIILNHKGKEIMRKTCEFER